jgi:hypothetical protein
MPDIISIGECMVEFFCDGPMARARSFQRASAAMRSPRRRSAVGCIVRQCREAG